MGTEGNHLVVHPLGHATGFPFNVIERIRVRQHAHLPRAFRGPRQNGPQLLDVGGFQRAFLWRTAACCSLSQDYPALCDGIFTKFHSVSLAGVTCRCGSVFEGVAMRNRAVAGGVGHFEILCEFQRIHGASIFAKAAEHAPRSIIGEVRQHFPTGGVVTLPAHYNQVLGAGQRAQIAANTQRFAGLWIVIQPWRAAIALRHHRPLQRVLLGNNILGMLCPAGDREAFQKIHLKQSLQEFPHAPSLLPPSPIVKQRLLSFYSVRSIVSIRASFPDQVKPWIPFLLPPHVILTRNMEADTQFIQEALAEARPPAPASEVPIGAVLVHDGKILSRSGNRTIRDCDPTAHAEIVVLREAARLLTTYRLADTTLYVTIEPCSMCAGAIIQARVPRLVYGADDPKGGAVRSCFAILSQPRLNHQVEVTSHVLAADCAAILQSFFPDRR